MVTDLGTDVVPDPVTAGGHRARLRRHLRRRRQQRVLRLPRPGAAGPPVLLDCGRGVLSSLQHHLEPTELDAVVINTRIPTTGATCRCMRNALRYVLHHGVLFHRRHARHPRRRVPVASVIAFANRSSPGMSVTVGALRVRTRARHPL